VRRRQGILLLCSVSVVMAATVLAGTSSQFKDAATGHTGAAGAGGTAGEPNAVEAYAGTDETPGRLHSVRRQLQSLNISSIARRQDPNSTRRLHDYIEYLNSLRLPQPKPASTGTETSEPSPGNAGETTVNSQPVSGGTAQSEPNLPAEQGGNDELDRAIAAILERPDEIAHPLEAAQMLYLPPCPRTNGRTDDAARPSVGAFSTGQLPQTRKRHRGRKDLSTGNFRVSEQSLGRGGGCAVPTHRMAADQQPRDVIGGEVSR